MRPGVVEQAAHDAVDTLQLPYEAGGHLGIGAAVGPPAPAPQHFDIGADGSEWIADLVGDACGETAHARQLFGANQLTLGVEQMIGHAIEPLSERGEVGRLRILRSARRQIPSRDRFRGRADLADRPQHVTRDQVAPKNDEHPDVEEDDREDERKRLGEGEIGGDNLHDEDRADAEQQGRGREERQVEEQLGPE